MSARATLALDAATYTGSVAVIVGSEVLAERDVAMRGVHEERLLPAVAEALEAANVTVRDLGRIVCGAGPGSFTSLRIAGAIAKGIATARAVPLFAVPSLALVVAGAEHTGAPGRWLAVLDAMRGDVYAQPFDVRGDWSVAPLAAPALFPRAELSARAAAVCATPIGPAEPVAAAPRAGGVTRLEGVLAASGAVDLATWEPEYGRLAEAQVKWERAHGRPLPGA
ncbi:MAG TPA: tRNA (adenosine(37)-N6)-threonylcarbamoyltransferase complex dimerization subunit type 1 TsaB [Gemmatimonadaceae bacterium]|nr:tRNA (adenosine(37)-N6)-threonylcarbamoyltransferase complex dimerization subunit type 1 TsaB [Gemmatimonadaceae bacterium]